MRNLISKAQRNFEIAKRHFNTKPKRNFTSAIKISRHMQSSKLFAEEGRYLSILQSKWDKIKFNLQNYAINRKKKKKKNWKRSPTNFKHFLVRNATSAMFQNKKLTLNAPSLISEVALCPSLLPNTYETAGYANCCCKCTKRLSKA